MRDLVIGDGERLARAGIERAPAELVAHGEQPGLAQHAVDVHGPGDVRDAVLGEHDDPAAALAAVRDQLAADGVDRAHVGRMRGSLAPRRCRL